MPDDTDERILGTDETDTIDAQGGSDTIFGDAGDDTLAGGEGRDIIRGGSGNDTILDFTEGDDLIDLSAITDITGFSELTITQVGTTAVIDLSSQGGGTIRLDNVTGTDLEADDFTLQGSSMEGDST